MGRVYGMGSVRFTFGTVYTMIWDTALQLGVWETFICVLYRRCTKEDGAGGCLDPKNQAITCVYTIVFLSEINVRNFAC